MGGLYPSEIGMGASTHYRREWGPPPFRDGNVGLHPSDIGLGVGEGAQTKRFKKRDLRPSQIGIGASTESENGKGDLHQSEMEWGPQPKIGMGTSKESEMGIGP